MTRNFGSKSEVRKGLSWIFCRIFGRGGRMKTSELKEIARKNEYEFSSDGVDILLEREINVFGTFKNNIIKIREFCVNRVWIKSCGYTDDADMNMMEAAMAYAKTPLEDREEPKRFYLRHKWIRERGTEDGYLNKEYTSKAKIENSAIYFISTKEESTFINTQFTQVEIDDIKKRSKTGLEDFEQIEVEE